MRGIRNEEEIENTFMTTELIDNDNDGGEKCA